MSEKFQPVESGWLNSAERIEHGVWRPGIFDQYGEMAAGASTKQLEQRSTDEEVAISAGQKKPAARMRIMADARRTIGDRDELATALKVPTNSSEVDAFRDKKVVAGLILTRLMRELDPESDPRNIIKTGLEHGATVVTVDAEYLKKSKAELASVKADGLITNLEHVPLMVAAADCAPVIIYDPVKKAIGVFHSGWKGTLQQISRRGIEAMSAAYGTQPQDLRVAVGPHADGDHYEVGADVYTKFMESVEADGSRTYSEEDLSMIFKSHPTAPGKYFFDSGNAIAITLRKSGIPNEQIEITHYSTMIDNDKFSSERVEGTKDRDNTIVMAILK